MMSYYRDHNNDNHGIGMHNNNSKNSGNGNNSCNNHNSKNNSFHDRNESGSYVVTNILPLVVLLVMVITYH